MELWKANAASNANPSQLFEIIKNKTSVAVLKEDIKKKFSKLFNSYMCKEGIIKSKLMPRILSFSHNFIHLGCGTFVSAQDSFLCYGTYTNEVSHEFPGECALRAVTKAVKECLKREKMKIKYEELKDALLLNFIEQYDATDLFELINFDNKFFQIITNKVQLSIQLFVREVETDFISNKLYGPGENRKQLEYLITNRSNRNCLYVVKLFDQRYGITSQPFFLCYDVSGIGEREKRWPEVPALLDGNNSPRIYSVDCKCTNYHN